MPVVAAGCTFEVVVYSSSRQGPNMQFFVEDSTQQVELAQPVVAHPVKSLQVGSMMQHAPPSVLQFPGAALSQPCTGNTNVRPSVRNCRAACIAAVRNHDTEAEPA